MTRSLRRAALSTRGRAKSIPLALSLLLMGTFRAACAQGAVSNAATVRGTSLVYAGDRAFPPYEFLDPKGKPAGMNVDLIRAIARSQGIELRIDLRPWNQVPAGLEAGRFDVAAMYRSTPRAREVDFAITHELIYHQMFIRKGARPLGSLTDIKDKRVLVENNTLSVDLLTEMGYGGQLKLMPSEPAALEALAQGKGDVAIVTQTVGRPFRERSSLANAIVETGPPVLLSEYAFVTRKGRPELIELLNRGLAELRSSGEYERIYARWLRPDHSAKYLRITAIVFTTAVLATGLFVAWNLALRRQVARQTSALRQEFEAREKAMAALAETEEALRQAQKMEAIGRLAGGVAHDFNNILSVIQGWASLLHEELANAGRETMEVEEILAASERAARLTKQLLAFSRATPIETTRIDLGALVSNLQGMLQRLVGEQIQVEAAAPPDPVFIDADRSLVEQILLNLAANARDAMTNGGSLKVTVGNCPLPQNNKWLLPEADYATLLVADTGTGMDSATLARIFEPFFTTKEIGRGTGLGLATVHACVQKLGGKISVDSTLGQGSRFLLLLPKSSEKCPPSNRAPEVSRNLRPPARLTILLVEDDEALRRIARLSLEHAGHRVIEARDGEEAEDLVRGESSFILVTDVVMPKRNGPRLAAQLRLRIPDLRVLYVSGYVSDGSTVDLDTPGTAFLAKPYTGAALADAVHQLAAFSSAPA
jgi:two-component system, cell cycle sensor histidine kinase and response regulator CckA